MNQQNHYKLYDQLEKLDYHNYFVINFRPTNLLTFFQNMNKSNFTESKRLMFRILKEIKECQKKQVYVVMKWLIFVHQLLSVIRSQILMELLQQALNKMKRPKLQNKYDQYFYNKLVQPYKHYLRKLITSLQERLQGPSPSKDNNQKIKQNRIYCQYNLIVFGYGQFQIPIKELSGAIRKIYPCLINYIGLISKDLMKSYRKIRLAYEQKSIQFITFIEIQRLGSKLQIFNTRFNAKLSNWIQAEANTQTIQYLSNKSQFREQEQSEQLSAQVQSGLTQAYFIK